MLLAASETACLWALQLLVLILTAGKLCVITALPCRTHEIDLSDMLASIILFTTMNDLFLKMHRFLRELLETLNARICIVSFIIFLSSLISSDLGCYIIVAYDHMIRLALNTDFVSTGMSTVLLILNTILEGGTGSAS